MTLHFASDSPLVYITNYIQFANHRFARNKFCSTGIAGIVRMSAIEIKKKACEKRAFELSGACLFRIRSGGNFKWISG